MPESFHKSPPNKILSINVHWFVDFCVPDPCQNDATCNDEDDTFYCACAPGFTGTKCETDLDEYESNPCMNNATCHNRINNYTCQCITDFTGTNCNCKFLKDKFEIRKKNCFVNSPHLNWTWLFFQTQTVYFYRFSNKSHIAVILPQSRP